MFITFEGPDGCGKTTQVGRLGRYLIDHGYDVVQTREPGGTRISEQIRNVVHNPDNPEMGARAEMLLYAASRAQHVDEIIRPALEAGRVVLCDRFADSTYAYQGYGRGLDLDTLRTITRFATGGLVPDLTVYIDIDPETGLSRRQRDGDAEWNRLDDAEMSFHERVRAGYQELIATDPDRWLVFDGGQAIDVLCEAICEAVTERLERV